jgi:hypothetical protein
MIRDTWIEEVSTEPRGHRCQAGGLVAISRRLSEATPPEERDETQCIPEGCQRGAGVRKRFRDGPIRDGLRSLRDRIVRARGFRGCRKAQPPANSWHPFGMAKATRVGGHLKR